MLALLFSAHRTVLRALRAQAARSAAEDARRAWHGLADELRAGMALPGDRAPFLARATDDGYELRFTAALRPAGVAGADRYAVERITYRAEPLAAGGWTVRRVREPLRGAGAAAGATTNVLLAATPVWEVACFDGRAWHDRWPAGGGGLPFPAAVRLRAVLPGGPDQAEDVLETPVPAGVVLGGPS